MKYLLLLFSILLPAKTSIAIPPHLESVISYGCQAQQSRVIGSDIRWWHVHVSAVYQDHAGKWVALVAVKEGADRKGALRECELWMNQMDKALRKVPHPKIQAPIEEPAREDSYHKG